MTISPEALEKARAITHMFCLFPPSDKQALEIQIAAALQAERDAAAPKLPDDVAALVTALKGVDHMSVEDCFLQSPLFAKAATTIQSLAARNAELEMGLEDLLSWFPDKPSEPEWRIKAGNYGADAAVSIARSLLNKDRQP